MLTRLDHWLRERYLFQTHIYTMRLPDKLPSGVRAEELPESPTRRYSYRLVANTNEQVDRLVAQLNDLGLMFATQVTERKTPLKMFIAPKGGSAVLRYFWLIAFFFASVGAIRVAKRIANDEELRAKFSDAVQVFKENAGP
jgi:hypothetical protein